MTKVDKKRQKRNFRHLAVVPLALVMVLAVYTNLFGFAGVVLASIFTGLIGVGALILPFMLVAIALYNFFASEPIEATVIAWAISVLWLVMAFVHVLNAVPQPNLELFDYIQFLYIEGATSNGGLWGGLLGGLLQRFLGTLVAQILLVIALIIAAFATLHRAGIFEKLVLGFFEHFGNEVDDADVSDEQIKRLKKEFLDESVGNFDQEAEKEFRKESKKAAKKAAKSRKSKNKILQDAKPNSGYFNLGDTGTNPEISLSKTEREYFDSAETDAKREAQSKKGYFDLENTGSEAIKAEKSSKNPNVLDISEAIKKRDNKVLLFGEDVGRKFANSKNKILPFINPNKDVLDAEEEDTSALNQQVGETAEFKGTKRFAIRRKSRLQANNFPPIDLLNKAPSNMATELPSKIRKYSRDLEATLLSYDIQAKVMEVNLGAMVNRYSLVISDGNLDNLADLRFSSGTRVEMRPDSSYFAIEVPNREPQTVFLRDILESKAFNSVNSSLTLAMGKDVKNNIIVADLMRMPHLLMAGAANSGKTVLINSIIASILYKSTNDQVKFLLIDPKLVEMNVYNGLPHLLSPIISDPKKAISALQDIVSKLKKRANLNTYKIVIIINELSSLLMENETEVEELIATIATHGRAAGVHMVLATERPEQLTSYILDSIPSKLALTLSYIEDSEALIGVPDAEKLLGKGDTLFLPRGQDLPLRLQISFVSNTEIESLTKFFKSKPEKIKIFG
ncbi:MAG: DNA translocase FtsK 4TM domain-containing protein [Turicibacter sp.]|nr:DNA translocase FtsK 4TM domain-containing protein [Turicibacter sp.]